jgi:L-asparagine transporter-like permease
MSKSESKRTEDKKLQWWQLSLLGVACTIGTGYFLGSGIAIRIGGPSVLIAFLLAAFGTYVVFDVLAKMTMKDPQKGSFRSYAKKAFGHWAGFSSGWVYWSSELLIMGSQMTALSLFSRFWFPDMPMWVLASGYAVLGLGVIIIGTKLFDRVENIFAVIKIAAIVMFVVIAAAGLFGWLQGSAAPGRFPTTVHSFFPTGASGLWSSLLFAFYAFGGIEIMGLMATRLDNPKDAPKAGKIMLLLLATIYVLSLCLALTIIAWDAFPTKESPFLTALNNYNLPFVPHVFNAVLIIAGFSTMVASLFAVTSILVTLAEDHDAPSFFSRKSKGQRPLRAISLTTGGLLVSIVMALLLPEQLYEYVTTAAGLMLLYNWFFILASAGRLLQLSLMDQVKRYSGMLLIGLAVSGTLFHATSRPGFFVSLAFAGIIGLVTLLMRGTWKRQSKTHKRESAPTSVPWRKPAWSGDQPMNLFHLSKQSLKRLDSKIKSKADE